MARGIIIVNKAGGVGKTTISQLLYTYLDKNDNQYGLISIEGESNGKNYQSPLRRAIPSTRDVTFSAGLGSGPDDQLRAWCSVVEPLLAGNHLADFGANALSGFQAFSKLMRFDADFWQGMKECEGRMKPVMVIPVTAGYASLSDAADLLSWLFRDGAIVGFHHIVIVENQVQGSVHFPEEFDEVVDGHLEKISKVTLSKNEFELGVANLSSDARKLNELAKTPEILQNRFMDEPGNMFALARAANTLGWIQDFEYELNLMGLMKKLKLESKPSVSTSNSASQDALKVIQAKPDMTEAAVSEK